MREPYLKNPWLLSGLLIVLCINPVKFVMGSPSPDVREHLLKARQTAREADHRYIFEQCRLKQRQPFDVSSPKPRLLLIGDSQACDFYNAMYENKALQNYQISLRYIPHRCQPSLGVDSKPFIQPDQRDFCANAGRVDHLLQARSQAQEADLLIFAARWKPAAARVLPQTLQNLKLRKHQRVIVVGSKHMGRMDYDKYLSMDDQTLLQEQNQTAAEVRKANKVLRTALQGRYAFIDQQRLVCQAQQKCRVFTDDGQVISYDGWHLTPAGARFIGKTLLDKTVLGKM